MCNRLENVHGNRQRTLHRYLDAGENSGAGNGPKHVLESIIVPKLHPFYIDDGGFQW